MGFFKTATWQNYSAIFRAVIVYWFQIGSIDVLICEGILT